MASRQTHIDALKLLAAVLIVLHHFTAYGPLSLAMDQVAPALMTWFFDEGNKAVQVFFVISGYLCARSLAPLGHVNLRSPWQAIQNRYLRLVPPYAVAVLLAVLSAALTRRWLSDDFIPLAPHGLQLVSHFLLLSNLLGHDALSAGIWYVAIDFQLYVLMTLLLWCGRHEPRRAKALVLLAMLVSLFYFNRLADWDNWGLYFFGSYALGAAALWAGNSVRTHRWLALLLVLGALALALDFRGRIALALGVAVLLGLLHDSAIRHSTPTSAQPAQMQRFKTLRRWVHHMGQASYALFLVHFSVLMLSNALFAKLTADHGAMSNTGVVLHWLGSLGLCVLVALLFEHWVEIPLSKYFYPKRHKG